MAGLTAAETGLAVFALGRMLAGIEDMQSAHGRDRAEYPDLITRHGSLLALLGFMERDQTGALRPVASAVADVAQTLHGSKAWNRTAYDDLLRLVLQGSATITPGTSRLHATTGSFRPHPQAATLAGLLEAAGLLERDGTDHRRWTQSGLAHLRAAGHRLNEDEARARDTRAEAERLIACIPPSTRRALEKIGREQGPLAQFQALPRYIRAGQWLDLPRDAAGTGRVGDLDLAVMKEIMARF